jgi:hypothetical protein
MLLLCWGVRSASPHPATGWDGDLTNLLLMLALNHNPPYLHLSSSWGYWSEPLQLASVMCLGVIIHVCSKSHNMHLYTRVRGSKTECVLCATHHHSRKKSFGSTKNIMLSSLMNCLLMWCFLMFSAISLWFITLVWIWVSVFEVREEFLK